MLNHRQARGALARQGVRALDLLETAFSQKSEVIAHTPTQKNATLEVRKHAEIRGAFDTLEGGIKFKNALLRSGDTREAVKSQAPR